MMQGGEPQFPIMQQPPQILMHNPVSNLSIDPQEKERTLGNIYTLVLDLTDPEKRESALLELRY
jgi:hypothetical protein